MKEIRKNQIVDLLSALNGMYNADFGHDYASFHFSDVGKLLIAASTRSIRVELELLLSRFQGMCVYVDSNTDLQVVFYDVND